jgi:hypothetical protein
MKLDKGVMDFLYVEWGFESSVLEIAPGTCEGFYVSSYGQSYDELVKGGLTEEEAKIQEVLRDVIYGASGKMIQPGKGLTAFINLSLLLNDFLGISAFAGCLDDVGGWAAWRQEKITPEMIMDKLSTYNNQQGIVPVAPPITFLPGKSTIQEVAMIQIREQLGRNVRHVDGSLYSWVPPLVIPERGACPPSGGWMAPPLEGSIHYGYPWDEDWTFEKFVSTYDIPLWWAIMEWGVSRPDYKMDKDLVYKTLDKYFDCKKVVALPTGGFEEVDWSSPEKRVEKVQELLEMYYLPDQWVEWLNEYMDNQKSKIGGLV